MISVARAMEACHFWVWSPLSPSGSSGLRRLQALCRILSIVAREFVRDEIPIKASALSFTVILSLIPALAFTIAVLKGLVGEERIKGVVYGYIERLESNDAHSEVPHLNEKTANKGIGTASSYLRRAADLVFEYVDQTDFATLGAVGMFGFLLAFYTIINSIETALNSIWRAYSDRPIMQRIANYLLFLIILPLSASVLFSISGYLSGSGIWERFTESVPVSGSNPAAFALLNVLLFAGIFALLYRVLPHHHVPINSALVGGVVGGTGWTLAQFYYIKLQVGVTRYNAIFGSFATLPLFLVWIYAGWIVFLIGAETAYALQVWRGYRPEAQETAPAERLALAFDLLHEVFQDFSERKTSRLSDIAMRLSTDEGLLQGLLEALEKGGVLRCSDSKRREYLPATNADKISADEVIDAVFGEVVSPTPGGKTAKETLEGMKKDIKGLSLEKVLRSAGRNGFSSVSS
ncbi:MAG: YihY/virulence factor BrkB family protein [Deltaproteobacteria bacterium]